MGHVLRRIVRELLKIMHVDGMISCEGSNWLMHEGSAVFRFRRMRILWPEALLSEFQEKRLWQD